VTDVDPSFTHRIKQRAVLVVNKDKQTNKQTNIHTYTHIKTCQKLTNVLSIPNIGANIGKYRNMSQNNEKHEL